MQAVKRLLSPGAIALYSVTCAVVWGVWYVHRGQKLEKEVRSKRWNVLQQKLGRW